MNKLITHTINHIIGQSKEISRDNRLLNAYIFIGFCNAIVVITVNSFQNLPVWVNYAMFLAGFGYMVLYFQTRFKRRTAYIKHWLLILTLTILTIAWFGSQGVEGSAPYFYFCFLVVFLTVFKPNQHKYIIYIVFCHLLILGIVQYRFPQLITSYKTKNDHVFDLYTSIIVCLIFIYYLVVALNTNYEKERITVLAREMEIEKQHSKILKQTNLIHLKNRKFMDSINYALRIQEAMLPNPNQLSRYLPEHFVFFKPCDIVSGDFYWFKKGDACFYIAVADCTGHGVPGAFMSVLGLTILDEVVRYRGLTAPNVILGHLRKRLIKALNQNDIDSTSRDGMDIALLKFDFENNVLEYAGANIPLYLFVRDNTTKESELTVFKPDSLPIGFHPSEKTDYTLHQIPLKKNETIYICSDGYQSQFGGENDSKFLVKRLKETLSSFQDEPMEAQRQILEDTINKWQGTNEQVDDILVIGIRIGE